MYLEIKLKNLFANLQYWREIFHFKAKSYLRLTSSQLHKMQESDQHLYSDEL